MRVFQITPGKFHFKFFIWKQKVSEKKQCPHDLLTTSGFMVEMEVMARYLALGVAPAAARTITRTTMTTREEEEEAGGAETPTIADPLAVRLLESCSNRVALYLKIKLLLKLT